MTTSNDGKAFLQLCLSKRLLDKPQAKEIWSEAQQTGSTPQRILVERGLMASHTVAALEKELLRAQEPRTIGGFQLIKTLGQGGMATVFLARQVSLGREVALKLMSPQIATNPEATDRFLREARVAATVNHPNVISIIDVGQADGQLYMALELVTGGDAAQLAARFGGKLPEARALELLIDCAKGLQALYEARLVHRDLKPSNIFITGDGVAKLGDLGLARSEDGADRMTMTGHLVGTPAFMSPEQAGGEGTVDIRSDIYSLGATLFALVAGRQPFVGNSPIAVAAKALTEAPPDARSLVPELSATTATLILRTMAKNSAERFQTPRDLREALEQALAQAPHGDQRAATRSSATIKPNDPPTPVTIPGGRRAPGRAGRRRQQGSSWMMMSAVVLVAIGAMIGFVWFGHATESARAGTQAAVTTDPAPSVSVKPLPTTATEAPVPAAPAKPPTAASSPPAPIAVAGTPSNDGARGIKAEPPPGADPPHVAWATAQGKDAFGHWLTVTIKGVEQRLRWLPPGTSVVGSPPDEPGRNNAIENLSTVTFTYGSWLADTECTQALWHAVMGNNPATDQGPRLPVTHVSVAEAIAFTRAVRPLLSGASVRLPSRAEWERACRAGTRTVYATGDDPASLDGFANLFDRDYQASTLINRVAPLPFADGFVGLAPVASLKPNAWGYHDMHGNVSEYVLSLWSPLPPVCQDPFTNDNPDSQVGFIRGGAFDSDGPFVCRAAAHPFIGKGANNPNIGFRFLIEGPH